ncbi:MAG: cytochrome c biogenesis heme-transporting ATPase CcmA [Pseudomonadota bacterium]
MPSAASERDVKLTLCSLTARRGDLLLFENLSASLQGGEALQVMGPNGGGKTTLLRVVAGLFEPDAGDVLWNDEPSRVSSDFAARMLYLGHAVSLKTELTAEENLRFAAALAGRPPACSADEALRELGLPGFGPVRVGSLSAGQKRRVALARLVFESAGIWILDEPFTALDDRSVAVVRELIRNHLGQDGVALFTSHQPVGFARDELQALVLAS